MVQVINQTTPEIADKKRNRAENSSIIPYEFFRLILSL